MASIPDRPDIAADINGLLAEAPIRLFVMGANVWRDEQQWPLARAVDTRFYLHAGGE